MCARRDHHAIVVQREGGKPERAGRDPREIIFKVKRGVHPMRRSPIFEQKKEADSCESASWFKLSYGLD
jgi:hypothetical protein